MNNIDNKTKQVVKRIIKLVKENKELRRESESLDGYKIEVDSLRKKYAKKS